MSNIPKKLYIQPFDLADKRIDISDSPRSSYPVMWIDYDDCDHEAMAEFARQIVELWNARALPD